jgi:hypothetical protein
MKSPAHLGTGGEADGSKQLELFNAAPLSPAFPSRSTLAGKGLAWLLQGQHLTTPEFQLRTKSWRLAAYVEVLRKRGWPIMTTEIPFSDDASRTIASYSLSQCVLMREGGMNG